MAPRLAALVQKAKFSTLAPQLAPTSQQVGATSLQPNTTIKDPETAAYDAENFYFFASGGGFSNVYPVPNYQAEAVADYFETSYPTYSSYGMNDTIGANSGLYNRQGRGYPDVAANGDKIAIWTKAGFGVAAGTSASAPVFASVINLINEERLYAGKSPVGFVNPVLYANPSAFNDIKVGNNSGCGTSGFNASQGWDPATGLGTPNYPKLLEVFMKLA